MKAETLKKSILQYAMQGKLVAQNPDDEPAGELLKRIKAEKEKLIKEGKIKREKPLPPITEEEIPYELPQGWEWVRLGEVCNIIMGQSPDGNTVVTVGDGIEFHQGKVFFGNKYLKVSNYVATEPTKIAELNSILLCVRAPVGKINITDRNICIGRGLCGIKSFIEISTEFLYYLLLNYEDVFVKQATGTTFVAITGEVVKKQIIPIPPLAEQQRIVEKLEQILPLIEEYGKNEEKLSELNQTLPDKIKQSVLQYAVQGKLVPQNPKDEPASELLKRIKAEKEKLIKEGKIKKEKPLPPITEEEIPHELPQGWEWVRLGEVCNIIMGQSPDGNTVVTVGDGIEFHQGKVFFGNKYLKVSNYVATEPTKIAELNSILLCVRAPVGKINITDRNICIGRGLCGIKAFIEISTEFLYYLLLNYEDVFVKQATGTTFVAITGEVVKKQIIPIPPLAEQQRIVEKLEQILPLIEELG